MPVCAPIPAPTPPDIPAAATFLSPRNFMNNGATAAAVAADCAGVYVETDF